MRALDRAELLRRLGVAAAAASLPAGRVGEALAAADSGRFPSHPRWKLAFLSHLTTSPQFVALQYGVEDACALIGCSFTWTGSARGDPSEQVKALDAAISAGADAIALTIVDSKALEDPLSRAVDSGLPIVTFDADVAWSAGARRFAHVGVDPRVLASQLASRVVKAVGHGDVAFFVGNQAAQAIQPLSDAVLTAVRRSGSPVVASLVSTGRDVYKQLDAVTQYATDHKKVRGLFALDAGSTEGLALALKRLPLRSGGARAGGWGVLPEVLKQLDEGELDFTVDEQPYLQGFATVLQLFLAKISGGLVEPSDVHIRPVFVTKANVKSYLNTRTRYEGSSSKEKYPIS